MAKALIIDDENDIRELISMAFSGINIDCDLAATVKEGIKALKQNSYDFCITDMRLPDGDGLDLVAHIQRHHPELPVCVITAHGNVELAVTALKRGAFDFVNKPFDLDQLRHIAKSALKLAGNAGSASASGTATGGKKVATREKFREMIGGSSVMKKLAAALTKLARSQAPIFIYGESGTGKELAARSIHHQSARSDAPFIAVNCGAIPENLVESEFFGYKKGAFTGANKDQTGLFEAANGGTLFLDEVADLPLSMQVKLLRAIQERAVRPVGGDKEIAVNVRILSATHKDLAKLVEKKTFREDLYYRLNVIALGMPPLRNRKSDIPALTEFILSKDKLRQGREGLRIDEDALNKLQDYDYPGNVRELENILERAAAFCEDDVILADDIQFTRQVMLGEALDVTDMQDEMTDNYDFTAGDAIDDADSTDNHNDEVDDEELTAENDEALTPKTLEAAEKTLTDSGLITDNLDEYMVQIEREAIHSALAATDNNVTQAAEKLGISFRALRYKIKKLDIK